MRARRTPSSSSTTSMEGALSSGAGGVSVATGTGVVGGRDAGGTNGRAAAWFVVTTKGDGLLAGRGISCGGSGAAMRVVAGTAGAEGADKSAGAAGRKMRNAVPTLGRLLTYMSPPWSRTI